MPSPEQRGRAEEDEEAEDDRPKASRGESSLGRNEGAPKQRDRYHGDGRGNDPYRHRRGDRCRPIPERRERAELQHKPHAEIQNPQSFHTMMVVGVTMMLVGVLTPELSATFVLPDGVAIVGPGANQDVTGLTLRLATPWT